MEVIPLNLESVFSQNPAAEQLQKEDYGAIFPLFESVPTRVGGLDFVDDRSPNFEKLLECQASHHYTFVARLNQQLRAMSSVSWGARLIQRIGALPEKVNVSYAGDFRMLVDSETIQIWQQFYGDLKDLIFTSPEFGPSRYLLAAVIDGNVSALRSLMIENSKQKKIIIEPLRKMQMVNFFFRKPWRFSFTPTDWVVKRPSKDEEKAWREWLAYQHQKMNFGFDFSEGPGNEWDRRKSVWPDWNFRYFLSVYNEKEQRVLMTMPWSPTIAKRLRVATGTVGAQAISNAFRWMGFNHPKVGESFKTLYLTHLCFSAESNLQERRKALLALLDYLKVQGAFTRFNMVSFADQWQLVESSEFKSYYSQKTEIDLYLIRRPDENPIVLTEADIDFELALV